MKVEIWSDIMCPFCYIGKRNFEHALEQFDDKNEIDIQWRSFELAPEMETDPSKNTYEYLAEKKGWTLDYTKKVHAQLTETAREAGLDYNFDTVVPANSFNAHRLLHLAADHQLQNELKERLFASHFTEGKNIDDKETLVQLGVEIGLPEEKIREILQSDLYADEVENDKYAARQVGVQGVPFFVLNNKYAVSGAQPSEVFLEALQKAYKEFEEENSADVITNTDGAACSPGGNC
ncbi:MAG: DsbA family oxidoreductase [Balneolaceae bacterium]